MVEKVEKVGKVGIYSIFMKRMFGEKFIFRINRGVY